MGSQGYRSLSLETHLKYTDRTEGKHWISQYVINTFVELDFVFEVDSCSPICMAGIV